MLIHVYGGGQVSRRRRRRRRRRALVAAQFIRNQSLDCLIIIFLFRP
jgi:hypothetical protein